MRNKYLTNKIFKKLKKLGKLRADFPQLNKKLREQLSWWRGQYKSDNRRSYKQREKLEPRLCWVKLSTITLAS